MTFFVLLLLLMALFCKYLHKKNRRTLTPPPLRRTSNRNSYCMCSRAFRTEQILCVLYPTHIVSEWRLATPLKIFLSQHHLKKNILGSHILLPQKSKKKNAKKYGQKKVTVALHNFKFNLLLTAVYLPFS